MKTFLDVLKDPGSLYHQLSFHGQISRGNEKTGTPSRATVVIPEDWIQDIFDLALGHNKNYYFLVRVPKEVAEAAALENRGQVHPAKKKKGKR